MNIIYNISINQFAVVANGWDLDCTDMAIFQCFHIFGSSPKTLRITTLEGQWFWVSAKKIIEELPILGIGSERQIKNRISKLIACGLIEKCAEDKTRDYYRFGKNYDKLFVKDVKKNFQGGEKNSAEVKEIAESAEKNFHDDRKKISTEDNISNNIIQEEDNNIPPIIPLKGESPKKPKADFKKLADDFCNTIDGDDWRELIAYWLDYKIDIKKPLRCQKSLSMFENRLRRESGNDIEVARGFIDRAVSQGWQDIHPDAGKSFYEQKKDYEKKEDERKSREWRAQEAERRAEAERQKAEAEKRRQREEEEYNRKYAEWQERERQRLAEDARKKAEYEQYLKDNDLPF